MKERLREVQVLWRQPDTMALWGIPYGMRPGQSPYDLHRAGNTRGWIWLGSPGWWGSLSRKDQEEIQSWLATLEDIPQGPAEWVDVEVSERREKNADPLVKFLRTPGDLTPIFSREDVRDTRRRVEFPVGTVVSLLDRTGYHDFQAVVAHPTVIATSIGDMVGIATPYGYDLHELRWFEHDAHEVLPEYVRPEIVSVVQRVRRTVKTNPTKTNTPRKLKNRLMR